MADVAAIYPILFRAGWNVSHISMEEISENGRKLDLLPSRFNAARILVAVPAVPGGAHATAQLSGDLPPRAKPAVDAASPGGTPLVSSQRRLR
jgi:hypothetical protein